ncbi:GNAT family N-acetyltransferase [Lysinibacillus boronitolerans]|uniref:GNAT family N-acetyltransferase n=1 Tax=Lysinibacillus boronitolerans TaxID=309788 RepID=UPI002899E605|nr:GNAT family N-acetyltransferase [Lysinibacillus boronitolerans]
MKLLIRRPEQSDIQALHQFFYLVIQDTYVKEGIAELVDDQQHEWETKKQYVAMDLESQGEKRFFWLALNEETNEIIGTIEYGEANEIIQQTIKENLFGCPEIGTVFVHPDYQNRGIGTMLLQNMLMTLENRRVPAFCLDSGYKQAQVIWQKKFGQPDFVLENYWGANNHHMIWKRALPFRF